MALERARSVIEKGIEAFLHLGAQLYDAPLERGWVPGERMGLSRRPGWYELAEIIWRIDVRDRFAS